LADNDGLPRREVASFSMKSITHFLPAKRPIPRALVAAIVRDAQSGAQVQVVRSKIWNAS